MRPAERASRSATGRCGGSVGTWAGGRCSARSAPARPVRPAPPPTTTRDEAIPFGRLLRVEWGKSLDTRAARWLLTGIALLTACAALVPVFLPDQIQQGWLSHLALTGLVLALLLPLVSILTLTSEWGQRSVLVTFTQEPRRLRVANVLKREIDQMIDLNQVEGRVRASSVKKIAEIIEKHPEEAVGIIRGWLHSEV